MGRAIPAKRRTPLKAVVKRGTQMLVTGIPVPVPGEGQVLIRVTHCGICGSDLHAVHNFDALIDAGRRTGRPAGNLDPQADVVFG